MSAIILNRNPSFGNNFYKSVHICDLRHSDNTDFFPAQVARVSSKVKTLRYRGHKPQ